MENIRPMDPRLGDARRCAAPGVAAAALAAHRAARSAAAAARPEPRDLDRPKQVWAFEQLLRRANGREAVTYDDVAGAL
jgi:hypothetical protein